MFICLDIETTGLSPEKDHVIEVAIVQFDHNKIIEEWSTLVKPPISIPAFTKRLTGIDDDMVKDAPSLEEVKDQILERIGSKPIMGHFIFFDVNFLTKHGVPLDQNQQLDSCQLAQMLLHNEPSYSLEVLTNKLNITQENAHRALDDVKANIHLFWQLNKHLKALPSQEKQELENLFKKSSWPWAQALQPLLKEAGDAKDLIENTPFESEAHSEKHVDLYQQIKDKEPPFLLEESTHTYQDVIDLALKLEGKSLLSVNQLDTLPEHPELSILKHPNDYLNEDRFKRFIQKDSLNSQETLLAAKVILWKKQTQTGEKSELRIIKEEKYLWKSICCQETNEAGSFYQKALKEASGKKIIAISHHHFLKDRSRKDPLLPVLENAIIAESEQLIKSTEKAWHISLDEGRLLEELHRLKEENPNTAERLDKLASQISILFGFIGMMMQKHGEPNDPRHTLVLEVHHRNTMEWNKVMQSSQSIQSTLGALGADLNEGPTLDELIRSLNYLSKIILNPGPILWMSSNQDEQPILHSFPEYPAELFQQRVWKDLKNLYLLSHHANTNDDFIFFKNELGLDDEFPCYEQESFSGLPIVECKTQVPNHKDPSNPAKVAHEISLHLPETEGNFFLYVTSKRSAENFFYELEKKVKNEGYKLFVQNMSGGMGKIHQMSLETDGKNCFVGDDGFLEFLIKKGIQLKLLAVHKMPFAYPGDPIQIARSKRYENAYKEFSLPQAQLKLQGVLHQFLGNEWEGKRILMLY